MRLVVAAAFAACVTVSAQTPTPFRAATDIVEIDVVVHGRDGAFVSDLTADDFIVEDGGRRVPIQQFYLYRGDGPTLGSKANAETSGVTSPDPASSAPPQRVFVVVFDQDHLTSEGFRRTQTAATTLFSQQFRNGDVGGVVVQGRMAGNRLTRDREELLKAVKAAKPQTNRSSRLFDSQQWPRLSEVEAFQIHFKSNSEVLAAAMRRACEDDEKMCERVDPEEFVRSKAAQIATSAQAESERTLQVLRTLATGLADIPGRKTILVMSEGFIADESWPLVRDTVALAVRANARFYAIDARGLERGLRSVFDSAPGGNDAAARMFEQMDLGADSINSLAVDTGGFVVRNASDLSPAIARISDDARNYYVLGIVPAAADGRFRRVSVKVTRAGASVRARRGYVAAPRPIVASTAAGVDAATPRVPAAELPPPAAAAGGVVSEAVPAAVSLEGAVVPQGKAASGLRVRPDAEAHASALAGGSGRRDPDAAAGWDAYQRGDVETARARLSAVVARNTGETWVYYALGMSNYALRNFAEAAEAWEHVRAGAADFEPVYFDLIDAYLQQKQHDHAIRIARAAIGRWPKDPELPNALGVVQTTRGALDDAIKSFQLAISIAPGDATAYFNLGKAMELRYVRSRRYVQQLRSWMANEHDRSAAIENYQRYLDLGGVYAGAARAGLDRLKWMPGK